MPAARCVQEPDISLGSTATLPATSSYQGDPRVAAYVSPPFSEYTTLIFKISSNVGAHLMLCLMAAKAGSTNCEDGFPVLASFLARAHVDRSQVVLADGHGGAHRPFHPAGRDRPAALLAQAP